MDTRVSGLAEGRNEGPVLKTGGFSKSVHIEFESLLLPGHV